MNNNFMGGSINHGNGWATTNDPRGNIYHYTGQQNNHRNDFSDRFCHGHNVMHEHARNHSRMQQIHQQEAERALREHEERERADRERIEREHREREEREQRERLEREQQERERQERERIEREHKEHVERERHEREQRERRERHEQDIKRSQCDSSSNHLKDVQFNKDESTKRSTIYNLETNKLLNIIDDQTDNDISISLSILKEKKALGVKWLEKIEDLLVRQNKHFSMINTHFDNCIRDVRASDQKNEIKDRLSTHWNELRNIEISNKKMTIGFSQRERDEITKFISTVDRSIITLNEKLSSINNTNETNNITNDLTANNAIQNESLIRKLNSTIPPFMVSAPKPQRINPINDIASTAGKIVSVPVVAADMVEGIVNTVIHPIDTAKSLYQFAKSDNKLETVDNALSAKFKQIKVEEEKGNIAGAFKAGLEQGKITTEVATLAMGFGAIPKVSKFAVVKGAEVTKEGAVLAAKVSASAVVEATKVAKEGAILAAKAEAFVAISTEFAHYTRHGNKYPIVKIEEIGMKWGGNIKLDQGDPFEKFIGKRFLTESIQSPDKFKVYDYWDETVRSAVSVKSLNTQTAASIATHKNIYSSIRKNINDIIHFQKDQIGTFSLKKEMISEKGLTLGIPLNTTEAQWYQIDRAIQYANDNAIKVNIILVK